MKKASFLTGLLSMIFAVAGCGSEPAKLPATSPTEKPAPASATQASPGTKDEGAAAKSELSASAAPAPEPLPEMKDLMSSIKGDSDAIEEGLKKHAGEGVDINDFTGVSASDPRIVKTEQKDDKVCYEFKVKAGISTHTYSICWKDGKIVELNRLDISFN